MRTLVRLRWKLFRRTRKGHGRTYSWTWVKEHRS